MYHTPYAKASIVEEGGQKTVGGTDCGRLQGDIAVSTKRVSLHMST